MQGLLRLHLEKFLFFGLYTEMQKYQKFSKLQADTRISRGSNVPIRDVFSFLIDAKDPETGRLRKQVIGHLGIALTDQNNVDRHWL